MPLSTISYHGHTDACTRIMNKALLRQYDRTHGHTQLATEIIELKDIVMESWVKRLTGKASH